MQRASKRAPQWLRDLGVFILVMGGAVGVCMLLSACYDDNNPFATSVFILAVVLISRFTNGYLPGVLAAAVGVVGVNYLFTYPFHEFNLSIDGYPLMFSDRCSSHCAFWRISSTMPRPSSESVSPSSTVALRPMIAASGVRISCETLRRRLARMRSFSAS